MNISKKLLWCFLFSLCLPVLQMQAKGKITGLTVLLFPLPSALYNAGYHERSSEVSSITKAEIKTTAMFKDVAGLDEAKADMQDVIEYLKNPSRFLAIGAKMPKGILLQGEPGNGKTLLARAMAGEVGCAFINVSGSDFNSEYMGKNSQKVQELFQKARDQAQKHGACIIFIDEIDSLATKRMQGSGSGVGEDMNNTLNTLLVEMDGFKQNEKPIIVLAATNRLDQLDSAILRPGRFDRIVHVHKPYIKDRIELLQIAFANSPLSDDIDLEFIARITIGFSGAELAHLVNEAAIVAVNDGCDVIYMRHVEVAYDNLTLGRPTKGMMQTAADLWITAVHEAGHLIGYIFQETTIAVHKVSITPRGNTLGVAHMLPLSESYSRTKDDMINRIVSCLAGREAELAFGFGLSSGASNDLEKAQQIAYDMIVEYGMGDDLRDVSYTRFDAQLPNDIATKVHNEVHKIIQKCSTIARNLIANHKKDIEKIAKLLVAKGTVQGNEIYRLLNVSQPKSRCLL
ncbi:MAG: AAA family ATPase [Candidatus Chromulinivorax sp.]|nr:AAA family ATPase [Candidatus Chromulinivorax sp.]